MVAGARYFAGVLALGIFAGSCAHAEPYIAVREGLKCEVCHVNPTGGGLRREFGDAYAQTQLPMKRVKPEWGLWTGHVLSWLRVGGDLRYDATDTQTPGASTVHHLEMQQTRVYLEGEIIPDRLILYADEQVAPGSPITHETYAMYWSAAHDWYIKAGRMYLPFAFRFEDQTALVYDVSSITMYAPDDGVELGWLGGHWDAQFNVSKGTFAGSGAGGREYGLQVSYVQSRWRVGLAANDDDNVAARRHIYGVFAGTRTGPVVWLGEVDAVENEFPFSADQTQAAMLLEGDWLIAPGNNLKLTFEHFDPDRAAPGNNENRWSLVYELTPVQFLQLRAGVRDYYGPSGIPSQRSKLLFAQLHAFF
jgi:hypothetical protein